MPTGIYKTTDIPENKVEDVVAGYKLDNPQKIEKIQQDNGLWTVIATWPGQGAVSKRFMSKDVK